MEWNLVDKISGMSWKTKYKDQIIDIANDIISDYEKQGIDTFVTYDNNKVFIIDECPIKKGK